MIDIPYNFDNAFSKEGVYQDYTTLRNRAEQFSTFETFGKDESGNYDMFYITLGNKNKPCIFLCGNIHPPEWRSTQATMEIFEKMKNGTYPDKVLQSRLLNEFYLVFIPVVNPWGVDRVEDTKYGILASKNPARSNVNGIDLNSDFYEFTQRESQNIRDLGNRFRPFACIDLHEYQPDYNVAYGRNTIIASGQQGIDGYQDQTEPYVIEWKQSMEAYIGEEMTRWTNILAPDSGLLRAHFARQTNKWTPYTLSYIIEVVRPAYRDRDGVDVLIEKLTEEEMYRYSMAHLYLYLTTTIKYFDDHGTTEPDNDDDYPIGDGNYVYSITTDHKTVTLTRNSDMMVIKILEEFGETCNNMIIETTIDRNYEGKVLSITRKEMEVDPCGDLVPKKV